MGSTISNPSFNVIDSGIFFFPGGYPLGEYSFYVLHTKPSNKAFSSRGAPNNKWTAEVSLLEGLLKVLYPVPRFQPNSVVVAKTLSRSKLAMRVKFLFVTRKNAK